MFDYLIEKINNSKKSKELDSVVDAFTFDNFFTNQHYSKLSKDADSFNEFVQEDSPIEGEEPSVISLNDLTNLNKDDTWFYDQLIKTVKSQSFKRAILTKAGFDNSEAVKLSQLIESTATFHTDYTHQFDDRHTDQKNNFISITLQIYLPDNNSNKNYGTEFYNRNNEKIYQTDFSPNTGYLLVSNNNSWHKSINGVYRKSILFRYYVPFDLYFSREHSYLENEMPLPAIFNRNKQNNTCCIIWNKDMGVPTKITDWFANMTFHNCIDLGFENISVINKPFKWDLYALKIFKYSYGFKKAFIFFGGFEWKNNEVYEYAVNLDMKDKVIAGLPDEDQFLRQCVIINLDKLDEIYEDDAHGDGGFFERFIGKHISLEDMWLPRKYYHPEVEEDKIVFGCLYNSNNIDDFPKLEYIKKHQTKTTMQEYKNALQKISYEEYPGDFSYIDNQIDNAKPINELQGTTKAFTLDNFFNDIDYKKISQDVIDYKHYTKEDSPIEGEEPSIITFDKLEKQDIFYKNLWIYFNTRKMKRKILEKFGYGSDIEELLQCMHQSICFHTEYPHQIDNVHSDQKFTLSTFTLQVYLPQDDSIKEYGTQFVNNNNDIIFHKQFVPNQGYMMESNNNSWHKPKMGVERKSLIVRYHIEIDYEKVKRVFNYNKDNDTCYIIWNKSYYKVHTKITDWFTIASLQNAQEQNIENIVATSNITNTLKYLQKQGYKNAVICYGGHIFSDNKIQQYAIAIENIKVVQDLGKIIGSNVSYYEPKIRDSAELLGYIQRNESVEYVQNEFPELAKQLQYIKSYRNNYSSFNKISKSIIPKTFLYCDDCQKHTIHLDTYPSGFYCNSCKCYKQADPGSYLSPTDYVESDFKD